ncbi:hypothetical protein K431DRAFT_285898 [Polychaeton citri CBS 116435]|uniref:Uncharacterized protein n=1 Tax=Polychaeton citri CBS 116435 TaxID=1314669 RepID=A0A9P4Q4G9_9PEZI|nr:hypothetical protein K431DRAFT_285898 [Polychaeton citri CBS 116435]
MKLARNNVAYANLIQKPAPALNTIAFLSYCIIWTICLSVVVLEYIKIVASTIIYRFVNDTHVLT